MATAAKSKKPTAKTRAAAAPKKKVATKAKPAVKKVAAKRTSRITSSQLTKRDQQLLTIWLLLVALFLAFVVKNYVIG